MVGIFVTIIASTVIHCYSPKSVVYIQVDCVCGTSFARCMKLRKIHLYLLRVFIINRCPSLSNASYASTHTNISFFFFSRLVWWIISIDYWMLSQPRIPGMCPPWSWGIILFPHRWIWFADVFRRGFLCLRSGKQRSVICLSCHVFVWSGNKVMLMSQREWRMALSAAVFWNQFQRVGTISSWTVG